MAFDFAAKNDINRLTVVTKANVIKTTDGLFLDTARAMSLEYPDVKWDDWYIDIMTAKLVDPKRRTEFRVFVLPNLYGDILTDEAAEFQGGVGTAGSANIGNRYSMFEAIHGSAPRMVEEGRAQYADPSSMIRASAMLLRQIGSVDRADRLEQALDIAGRFEKRLVMTGRSDGARSSDFADYILEVVQGARLKERWNDYQSKLVPS
jgi:isocitrate dehydrogenase (NAD+)